MALRCDARLMERSSTVFLLCNSAAYHHTAINGAAVIMVRRCGGYSCAAVWWCGGEVVQAVRWLQWCSSVVQQCDAAV